MDILLDGEDELISFTIGKSIMPYLESVKNNCKVPVGDNNFGSMEIIANRNLQNTQVYLKNNYYCYDMEDNLFIARKNKFELFH